MFRNISVLEEVSGVEFSSHLYHSDRFKWINFSQLICLEEEIAGDIVSQDYPLTPAG